jgi:hypothetical protein
MSTPTSGGGGGGGGVGDRGSSRSAGVGDDVAEEEDQIEDMVTVEGVPE